jgi:hypothetical protein
VNGEIDPAVEQRALDREHERAFAPDPIRDPAIPVRFDDDGLVRLAERIEGRRDEPGLGPREALPGFRSGSATASQAEQLACRPVVAAVVVLLEALQRSAEEAIAETLGHPFDLGTGRRIERRDPVEEGRQLDRTGFAGAIGEDAGGLTLALADGPVEIGVNRLSTSASSLTRSRRRDRSCPWPDRRWR